MAKTTKPFWMSKTIWGAILVAIGQALQQELGVPSAVGRVCQLVGLILVVIGRWAAEEPLSL